MKSAAIVTPYGLWNYGNRLQNYAVDRILKARDFLPTTLVVRNNWLLDTTKDLALYVGHHLLHLRGQASIKYDAFYRFDKQIAKRRLGPISDLGTLNDQFDLFVVGSDQIWNPLQVSLHGCEFAKGAHPDNVICISPSFGIESIPESKQEYYSKGISELKHLSVREESGRKIIKELVGLDAPVFADPTILVGRDVWDSVACDIAIPKGNYGVAYFLGESSVDNDRAISVIAQKEHLNVISLLDKSKPDYYASGPNDFVKLIAHSSAVITNSFHAALFALMYDVPLFLLERKSEVSTMSRFETIEMLFPVVFKEEEYGGVLMKRSICDGNEFKNAARMQQDRFYAFFDAALEKADLS